MMLFCLELQINVNEGHFRPVTADKLKKAKKKNARNKHRINGRIKHVEAVPKTT
jgi:hypothetical protein